METVPSAQLDATALEHFYVPAAGGKQIPLPDVATFEHDDRAAERGALRSDGVGDDLVQPRAGRLARRGDGRSGPHRAADAAGDDHRRILRARRRRSRIRSRGWASCC